MIQTVVSTHFFKLKISIVKTKVLFQPRKKKEHYHARSKLKKTTDFRQVGQGGLHFFKVTSEICTKQNMLCDILLLLSK